MKQPGEPQTTVTPAMIEAVQTSLRVIESVLARDPFMRERHEKTRDGLRETLAFLSAVKEQPHA